MPRKTIDISPKVEYLSILNEVGEVDDALMPDLPEETLVDMFRWMLTTRRLDERLINMQRQGRIGTYGPSRGQEASQVGTGMAIGRDDWTAQGFREMGMTLVRGWPLHAPMFFWGGYEEGNIAPEGVNDLPIAVPVASQLLHGVGIAWGMKLKKTNSVCLTYTGDGGTSEGDFHEAMNFGGVFGLPVVFIVQNNHFAISLPRQKQTRSTTLAQKAIAYGFDAVQVDGNDILAVYAATTEAVEKARAGDGPTLIECVTYRLSVHTTADDPTKYRSADEVTEWEKRDPLIRMRTFMGNRGLLDDAGAEAMEKDIQKQIKAAVERYESFGGVDLLDPFDHLYAEMPEELAEQRAEFAGWLEAEGLLRVKRKRS